METSNNISSLRQLLDEDSSRLISGEVQLKKGILEWMTRDTPFLFQSLMHRYLGKIENHICGLEEFCQEEQLLSLKDFNRIMNAFIEDINKKLSGCTSKQVKAACLYEGIREICYYKISAYQSAAAFAAAVGLNKAGQLFYQAVKDEKAIDEELSRMAEHDINLKTLAPLALAK
ncbi:DUF892 family protein [Mucilaginibacter gossypii]|uniref:DUF892 family protein n=1 Tax=Mucilaginibacter gossypii TaxID=551996 RepID=UPI000DCC12A6|nr:MULTISPECIES: DUF892 family protein [Mucilaginibacter]QTE34881.1 DUF892 family protein [Mucilaginibacter gossypii]RAV59605.1 hypothetical protein DIU36_05105 [Mucilaginibacter rubeus]